MGLDVERRSLTVPLHPLLKSTASICQRARYPFIKRYPYHDETHIPEVRGNGSLGRTLFPPPRSASASTLVGHMGMFCGASSILYCRGLNDYHYHGPMFRIWLEYQIPQIDLKSYSSCLRPLHYQLGAWAKVG